jgi:D-alanyl-D-alanine carboxypeptidase
MKKMQSLLSRSLAVFFFLCFSTEALAAKKKIKTKQAKTAVQEESGPECKAKLLLDAGTGEVLFEENIHEPLPPASMVKIMLAYVVHKKIEQGIVKPEDVIVMLSC